jgi:Domain of unknown function (DUF3786)
MNDVEVDRRFRVAWEQARSEWAAADPAWRAAQAGCGLSPDGVSVPFFGRPHLVTHPGGDVSAGGAPAHVAVSILLLHYLLRADGAPPAGEWLAFRELPDGMFYAAAFAQRAEAPLAQAFGAGSGSGLEAFRAAAVAAGGLPLELADAAFAFQALPRLALAVLVWAGDDEFPAQASVVFEAAAGHYLPAEDLAGLGGLLARRLISGVS